MSVVAEIAAGVGTLKSVIDALKLAANYRREFFEKVIRPVHSEAELAVEEYYRLFYGLKQNVLSSRGMDDRLNNERLYREGKLKRDILRARIDVILDSSHHHQTKKYCMALKLVFDPVAKYGEKISSAGHLVNEEAIFTQMKADQAGQSYLTYLDMHLSRIEQRWIAASQIFAGLCLKSYHSL